MRFVLKVLNIPLHDTMTSVSCSGKLIAMVLIYDVECIVVAWTSRPSSTRVGRKISDNMVSQSVKIEDTHISRIESYSFDYRVIFLSPIATHEHIC